MFFFIFPSKQSILFLEITTPFKKKKEKKVGTLEGRKKMKGGLYIPI